MYLHALHGFYLHGMNEENKRRNMVMYLEMLILVSSTDGDACAQTCVPGKKYAMNYIAYYSLHFYYTIKLK